MILKVILFICLLIFSCVDSWTVNLAEMKVTSEEKKAENNQIVINGAKNDKNPDVMERFKYAEGFEYQGYKEAKVSNVIRSGSIYLEGLSRALLDYRQTLESCREQNSSNLPQSCSTASEDAELVQKLSKLALETTRKLRDKTNEMKKDRESEENELLLQLAWFLDQLARLTGYKQNNSNVTDISLSTEQTTTATQTKDSLELLETVENGRPMSKLSPNVKRVVKRSTSVADVVKYYTKYRIWTGSNTYDSNSSYDVNNDLTARSRRSLPNKKYVYFRVSKNKLSNLKNIRRLLKKPNVLKVVVIKKLKNK